MGVHRYIKQHNDPDKGCKYATDYLGEQTNCLNCPFPECFAEKPYKYRNWKKIKAREKIIQSLKEGNSVTEVASNLDIDEEKVYEILDKTKISANQFKPESVQNDSPHP